jgi:hypothetical protein
LEIEAPNQVVTSVKLYMLQPDGTYKDSTMIALWYHEFEPARKVVMKTSIPVTGFIEIV